MVSIRGGSQMCPTSYCSISPSTYTVTEALLWSQIDLEDIRCVHSYSMFLTTLFMCKQRLRRLKVGIYSQIALVAGVLIFRSGNSVWDGSSPDNSVMFRDEETWQRLVFKKQTAFPLTFPPLPCGLAPLVFLACLFYSQLGAFWFCHNAYFWLILNPQLCRLSVSPQPEMSWETGRELVSFSLFGFFLFL